MHAALQVAFFISVTESRGGANTQLKQRYYTSIRSFALPGSLFCKDVRKWRKYVGAKLMFICVSDRSSAHNKYR